MLPVSEWLQWLETSALAAALRESAWAEPVFQVAHLFGVALLVGAIVPLNLRLLGAWPQVPLGALGRVLRTVAALGLMVALIAGAALFVTRAGGYASSPLFLVKMGFVCLGGINALMAARLSPERLGAMRGRAFAVAVVSLGCWITALVLGGLAGYV